MAGRPSTRLVALLRGVNVGGVSLAMAEFRTALTGAGFAQVSTYVQSGNALVTSAQSPTQVSTAIHQVLVERFGLDLPVIVHTAAQLDQVIADNPLTGRTDDPTKLHVTFLSAPPAAGAELPALPAGSSDELVLRGRAVYLYCPDGYGRTKLTNTSLERTLKVPATTRNWRTTLTLARLLAG